MWFYPHLRPRTWFKEEYRHLVSMRIPSRINGYVFEDDGCYVGQATEENGPWNLCCFQEDTEEECRETVLRFIRRYAEEAGTVSGSWSIQWHDYWPTAADKAYTR